MYKKIFLMMLLLLASAATILILLRGGSGILEWGSVGLSGSVRQYVFYVFFPYFKKT